MRHFLPLILSSAIIVASCSSNEGEKPHTDNARDTSVQSSDKIAEVTVMDLEPTLFNHEIISNGHVTAREKVDVSFPSSGIISAIYVHNGQRVTKGQPLAALDTYRLENQLEKDRNSVSSSTLEMQDVLIGQGYDPAHPEKVPADVMDLARLRSGLRQAELQLAATERDIRDATLSAPVSGVIANLTTKPHNTASTSQPLCRIINDGAMDVEFSVLEGELPMVRPGDTVSVTPFSTTESHTGRVSEINPMVDENGMVKVWATVDGRGSLIDGMNVRVSVRRAVERALVVPKSAVVLRSGRQVVFTLDGDKAIWNYVTTGLENLNQYTITDGLTPGMKVITSGNINLAHEAPVKIISD